MGGIASGTDAYEKIAAGASLVQLYTAFSYEGPPLVRRIKEELADILRLVGLSGNKADLCPAKVICYNLMHPIKLDRSHMVFDKFQRRT